MSDVAIYIVLMIAAVFVSVCSQILLKKAAAQKHNNLLREYLNFRVIFAYGLFGLSFMISLYILRNIPMTLVVVLDSTGYIFVSVLAWVFLKERLTVRKVFGILMIIAGILVFGI